MDRIVSKIAAGGLSAGVFLIWWPQHVHGEGLTELVLRGLLWTLSFEILLMLFGPLEQLAEQRVRSRMQSRRERVRARFAIAAPTRTGGAVALACVGLAAPLALLADAPREMVKAKPAAETKVVKQVIVKRPVIKREVVVRRVYSPAAAEARIARAATAPAPARAATTAAPPRTTAAKVTSPKTATKPPTEAADRAVATATEKAAPVTQAAPQVAGVTSTQAPAAPAAPAQP